MKRSFLPISLMLILALLVSYGCNREEIIPDEDQITSIHTKIMRIVDNGQGGVNIFVSVTDQHGKAIENLNENNFKIFRVDGSGVATPVNPNGPSTQPGIIMTALTMDYSGSMDATSITSMENAIASFINLKDPNDRAEIIKFSSNVQVTVPLTQNPTLLTGGLSSTFTGAGGSTALYRAIIQGQTDVMLGLNGNPTYLPSIIGFTDGVNNMAPFTMDTIIMNSVYNQIPVYTVGYGLQPDTMALKAIADSTGGAFFWSPSNSALSSLYQMVNGQLSSSTIVTVPGPPVKGKIIYRVTAKVIEHYGFFEDTDEKYFYY